MQLSSEHGYVCIHTGTRVYALRLWAYIHVDNNVGCIYKQACYSSRISFKGVLMKKAVMVGPDKPVIPGQRCFELVRSHQQGLYHRY